MHVEHFYFARPFAFTAPRHEDVRGYSTETFYRARLQQQGIVENDCVQDNRSLSVAMHTLRGMHFQIPPFAQAKIVRVITGRILDVAFDLRPQSAAYGKWIAVELSSDLGNQLCVPTDFARVFFTLEPNTMVAYKVSNICSNTHDRGLNWADTDVAIDWPLPKQATPVLSDKDRVAPMLRSLVVELKEFS
jgi:dTDP-4-dehydrorhamnose 3,5-epimerase